MDREGGREDKVECELSDNIKSVPCGGCLGAHETRTKSIEEDLECAVRMKSELVRVVSKVGQDEPEEGFAGDVLETEHFDAGRKVGVDSVFPEVLVVLNVISL